MKKNRFILFLVGGLLLLGFAIFCLASAGSLAQDLYLIALVSNFLLALGVTLLYLAIVFLRSDRKEDLDAKRAAARQAEQDAKDAQIRRLEQELREALAAIERLKKT